MRYHNITKDDMNNGEGLRVVLWIAGCNHACSGCHNPITWDLHGGLHFDEKAKAEIWHELAKDYVDGITFSGGDPLHPANRAEVAELIIAIRKQFPKKTIWLYTGFLWEEIQDFSAIAELDVLIDGKFEIANFSPALPWVGSSNQRVIDVPQTRISGRIILK